MNEVLEFPAITPPVRSYIPQGPWRAILADGRWSIVGTSAGESCQLDMNPFRRTALGDATMAMRIAETLNHYRQIREDNAELAAQIRRLLGIADMVQQAKNQGLDAVADLTAIARMVREESGALI